MFKAFKRILALLVAVLMIVSMTACGDTNSSSSNSTAADSTAATATQPATDSAPAAKPDPLGKYEPGIKMASALSYFSSTKFLNGDTADDNIWVKTIKDEMGIELTYKFSAPDVQYNEKMNIAIASADIPDAFVVTKDQLAKLQKSNLIEMDLGSVLEDYAGPLLKEFIEADGGVAMRSATVKGKLTAIPKVGSSLDRAEVMYIRTDWLKNVGLSQPKTMDDLIEVLKAFVEKDPDQNGIKDTVGLVGNKAMFFDLASFASIFTAYGAAPSIWVEKDGKLAFGSWQPEMKKGLAKLQEMYKAGLIDKEFAVKDLGKAAEQVIAGKAGIFFGNITLPIWPCSTTVAADDKAEWGYFPAISGDVQEPKIIQPFGVNQYYVVRKGYEHPEAMVKLMNLWNLKMRESSTEENAKYIEQPGVTSSNIHLHPFQQAHPQKNYSAYQAIKAAVDSKDPSKLQASEKANYDKILKLLGGDKGEGAANVGAAGVFYTPSSYDVVDGYVKNNQLLHEAFLGGSTATMTSKQATLDGMLNEVITKIIMGDVPVDEFDKVVQDIMKLGGQQITDEVNQWYQETK